MTTQEKGDTEADIRVIHKTDGFKAVDLGGENLSHYSHKKLMEGMGPAPWMKRIIYTKDYSGHLLCQTPGTGNRTHCHAEDDEWWVVLKGVIKWWIQDEGVITAERGDVVFVPKGRMHKIRTIGEEDSLRLAICIPDIPHFHPDEDPAPKDF
jgi:oxalate decarboxylase/phosphoglucose isomerase-like protein (cupin superfamily)